MELGPIRLVDQVLECIGPHSQFTQGVQIDNSGSHKHHRRRANENFLLWAWTHLIFFLITQNSVSSNLTHHFEMYESILFCCFLNCSNLTKHATYYTGVFSYFRLGGNWFTSARVYLKDSIYKKKLFVLKCKKCL